MKKILIFVVLMIFMPGNQAFSGGNSLRVAILKQADKCDLKVKGYYRIKLPYSEEELIKGKNMFAEVNISCNQISIAGALYNVFGVEIEAKKDGEIYINSRPYRGKIRFLIDEGKLTVVNIISLEDYLKGVLQYEVAHWWPMQALMAQAVAARTYALYMKDMNKSKIYDLTSNVLSQVYGGKRGERWRIKRAVNKTAGLILFYDGKVLPAFYHSTCGGHTDGVAHLWNLDIAPLKGVSCDFCRNSKHYRWQEKIKIRDFIKTFKQAGYSWEGIDAILVGERYHTGYVKTIQIFAGDKEYLISSKEFRSILGANVIRSRRFLLEKVKDYIDIRGYGWGHGIGLCQWGAYGMAKQGYDFRQILQYYYPASEIKKLSWDED
ncbi:MAG: SpoIID/LytB domain-containing protein [Candidatus Saelkia tenebricola]|nr:SpoIID/LytB domain-containing protein [Candidatus Saelkia tenebricola]